MKKKKIIFLKHIADIKFQAFGKSLKEVFSNSALAVSKALCSEKIKEKKVLKFEVRGRDLESLLYNFLEEFLFLIDSKNFILAKVKELKLDKKKFKISAKVIGDDVNNYELENDVKAITYHEMFVKKEKSEWVAQVVLDI